jgi:energy-coupling factor transporter ATP-binding protein EcfA2
MSEPSSEKSPLWPLLSVDVLGLFGTRTFTLDLDPVATIVTGENGSGKSTVLGAIHLLAEGHWARLIELPLEGLELHFADGSNLKVSKSSGGLVVSRAGQPPWSIDLDSHEPTDPRRRRDFLMLRRELERGRLSAGEQSALKRRLASLAHGTDFLDAPEWVAEVLPLVQTKSISARRLEHRLRPDAGDETKRRPEPVVEQFANAMRDRMRYELSRYAAESRQQEKTLPSRIVDAMQRGADVDSETMAVEVDELRAEVRDLADLLARVGLFDEEEDPDAQFEGYPRDNPNILLAIREVYRVARARLSRLSTLRSDLDLFATFLNERFVGKRIDLNQRTGIAVILETGDEIRPSELSSGEQQLLALSYELLFATDPRSVVLLDEPELSLHVAWLKGLLPAFADIGEHRELQFVIATHSPSILAGHTNQERSLDEL